MHPGDNKPGLEPAADGSSVEVTFSVTIEVSPIPLTDTSTIAYDHQFDVLFCGEEEPVEVVLF